MTEALSDRAYDADWRPAAGESLATEVASIRSDLYEFVLVRPPADLFPVMEAVDLRLARVEAIIRGKEQGDPGWVRWCLNFDQTEES